MLLLTHDIEAGSNSTEAVPMERRRGLRISQNRPVKIFEPVSSRYFAGQTCDVSSTGLRIEVPHSMPLRMGNIVSIHVGVSDRGQALANRRAMIPARVVWVRRDEDSGAPKMTAGIEFVASIAAHLDAA